MAEKPVTGPKCQLYAFRCISVSQVPENNPAHFFAQFNQVVQSHPPPISDGTWSKWLWSALSWAPASTLAHPTPKSQIFFSPRPKTFTEFDKMVCDTPAQACPHSPALCVNICCSAVVCICVFPEMWSSFPWSIPQTPPYDLGRAHNHFLMYIDHYCLFLPSELKICYVLPLSELVCLEV